MAPLLKRPASFFVSLESMLLRMPLTSSFCFLTCSRELWYCYSLVFIFSRLALIAVSIPFNSSSGFFFSLSNYIGLWLHLSIYLFNLFLFSIDSLPHLLDHAFDVFFVWCDNCSLVSADSLFFVAFKLDIVNQCLLILAL